MGTGCDLLGKPALSRLAFSKLREEVEHLSIGAREPELYGMVSASDVLPEIVRQAWGMGERI
jgi:hypothetical protein